MSHRYYWAVTQNLHTDVRECIWTIFLKQRKKKTDKRGQRKEGDKTLDNLGMVSLGWFSFVDE